MPSEKIKDCYILYKQTSTIPAGKDGSWQIYQNARFFRVYSQVEVSYLWYLREMFNFRIKLYAIFDCYVFNNGLYKHLASQISIIFHLLSRPIS